ncbi:uncharacterized protein Best2 [Hetaerina americana]|uniref:uncharacterized protein Best2 n=1 Tax=Hetaerina americana TaxID=62018 RepID=UPI003A7F3924
MTVTYSGEVANGSSFGCFWRILGKWRGSVYKLVWRELVAYLCLYFTLNLVYRYALNETQQKTFEKIKMYFSEQSETIPMSFVLGFYVTLIVKRWWEQYRLLPWPDSLALFVSAAIPGQDERGRLMRRNIVRYAMLSYVITLQQVSLRVKRRFPTWQHMVDAGLMMESEKKIFDLMDEKSGMSKYWMPLIWATNIINRARKEGHIQNDHVVQTMLVELSDIRRRLGSLIGYDTVCVPLVYTQVVTLSVYTYFVAALLGRQWVAPPGTHPANAIQPTAYPPDDSVTISGLVTGKDLDLFFPVFTVLQFCFYTGWLKVAEVLINPFGEDDDDIELNWLIDRHLKAAYMIVDEMHEEHPELLKDQYWEEVVPRDLPYTVASEHYRRTEPKGSAEKYKVKESDAVYANLFPNGRSAVVITTQALVNTNSTNSVNAPSGGHGRKSHSNNLNADDVYADYESVDTPLVERRKNWFQRQLHRMGSVRSANTTYSSGGLFNGGAGGRNAIPNARSANLYSGSGGVPAETIGGGANSTSNQKMSLYDRLMSRKSGRGGQFPRGRHSTSKMNGSSGSGNMVPVTVKNRPRIPTPDVTKESPPVFDISAAMSALSREDNSGDRGSVPHTQGHTPVTTLSATVSSAQMGTITTNGTPASAGLFGPSHVLHLQQGGGVGGVGGGYHAHHSDLPVVQVVLSPIKELEHLPHLPHHPHGTAALAQAVLSPALTSAGLATVLPSGPPSAASTPPPSLVPVVSTATTTSGSIAVSSIPIGSVVALANQGAGGSSPGTPILTYLPPQHRHHHILPATHTTCTLSSNTSTTSSHSSVATSLPPLALQLISDAGAVAAAAAGVGVVAGGGGSSESGIGSEWGEAEDHAAGGESAEEGSRSRKSSVASQKQQHHTKRGEVYV